MIREKALIRSAIGVGVTLAWFIVSLVQYQLVIALMAGAGLIINITCLTFIYRSK